MEKDHLITCLSAICSRFSDDPLEGRHEVARRTGLSEQYLYQVLSGKPMANGNKRSLGKVARAKIDKAFPGWMTAATGHDVEQEQTPYEFKPPKTRKLVRELFALAAKIDDDGLRGLLDVAQCFVKTHPLRKSKAA